MQYREVLAEDKRFQLINAFHVKTPGTPHHTLDDTYRLVAEHYWWEGMYFQVRDFVIDCNECHKRGTQKAECLEVGNVSKMVKSHSHEVLSKLNSQREKGLFCDVTLKTGSGHSFVAHKAVLAAVSEYFQELFTEMDSAAEPLPHVDLTGYNEESLLTLLEFSYTSILSLNLNTLTEVAAMARHLRMWPALEACSAFQHEEVSGEQFPKLVKPVGVSSGFSSLNSSRNQHCAFGTTSGFKRKRDKEQEGESVLSRSNGMAGKANTVDVSDENSYFSQMLASQCQSQASFSPSADNSFPCSPTRRMKLMDFKSPSSKRKPSPRPSPSIISSPSKSTRSSSPSRRLLRSTPGAALALRRLLPKIDLTNKKKRKTSSYSRSYRDRVKPDLSAEHARALSTPETPVKVKKEKENEEDICSVVPQDEVHSPRAQEKYRLLSFLGLQRKSLVPGPEVRLGWGQKKRLRKLKVSDYSLTARRKPRTESPGGYATNLRGFVGVSSSLSLCDMTRMDLLSKVVKVEPQVSPKNSTKKRDKSGQACVGLRTTRSQTLQKGCTEAQPNRPLRSHSRHPRNLLPQLKDAKRDRITTQVTHLKKATLRTKQEPKDQAISQPELSGTRRCQNPKVSPPGAKVSTHNYGSLVKQPLTITNTGAKRMVRYSSECTTTVKHKNTRQTMSVKERASCNYKNVTDDLQPELSGLCSRKTTGKNKKNKAQGKAREEKVKNPLGENSWNVSNTNHQHYSNPLYKAIKEEPTDPLPLTQALLTSDSSERGKRQSKPPIKLLDQGFLFDLCRPPCGLKREEESVDIYLTRSVSHSSTSHGNTSPSVVRRDRIKARLMSDGSGLNGPHWTGIGNRATSQRILLRVKMEENMTAVSQQSKVIRGPTQLTVGKKNCKHTPKTKNVNKLYPVRRQPTMLESIRRVQRNQLKGRRGLSSIGVHSCLQCRKSYRNCDDLIMHRIRHIEGKHWPCPLCSKTFFRELNVKNHIRTHNPKLYKCKQCITAS